MHTLALRALAALLLLSMPTASTARAQSLRPAGNARPTTADSALAARAARRAQYEFEGFRRWRLPRERGVGGGRQCDEHIGRICYWYDEHEPDPMPEPQGITSARNALIARLDSLAAISPRDGLIAGLRVWYRVEAGRASEAAAAARSCEADAWWCAALRGLALHAVHDEAASDFAFAAALASMPSDERCAWTDLSQLLDGELARRYGKLSCDERAALDARVWWLAQPLWASPANDLRLEHLSRATAARILRRMRNTFDMPWGDDLEEALVRYGWDVWWSRDENTSLATTGVRVIGHPRVPAYAFFPSGRAVDDPLAAAPRDWELRERLATTRYAPAYGAPLVDTLPHQAGIFRRGDSMLVVARYDLRGDTLFRDREADAALVVAAAEGTRPVVVRVAGGASGILVARAPWGPRLISLEVTAAGKPYAARARYAVRPADSSGLVSTLMLLDSSGEPPSSLESALARLRANDVLYADETAGLFWEAYDVRGDVRVEVTLTRIAAGAARRAAELLRVRGKPTPVQLRWADAARPGANGVWAGSVMVDVGDRPPGTYELALTIAGGDGRTATTSRTVRILPRAPR